MLKKKNQLHNSAKRGVFFVINDKKNLKFRHLTFKKLMHNKIGLSHDRTECPRDTIG